MMILDGIRVLDFTQYLAGPTVTRLMAEMGAEIIKIEIAPNGDPSRGLPLADRNRSGYFVQQNRGKQSLGLDLRQPEALNIVREGISAKGRDSCGAGMCRHFQWSQTVENEGKQKSHFLFSVL
ncbi:MAG: CoA transferase [Gammaproteobacteria bacterium]|nr:CoA transferase [Gammaproteobacteria bacterium]